MGAHHRGGASGGLSNIGLLRAAFFTLTFVVVLLGRHSTNADKEIDSDLTFTEESRALKRSVPVSSVVNSKSSQLDKDEDHWLFSTVHRVKRGLFDWFKNPAEGESQTEDQHSAEIDYKSIGDIDEDQDDYGDIETGSPGKKETQTRKNIPNSDDEDLYNSGDQESITEPANGQHDRGDGEHHLPPDHPVYFRLTLIVMEPYLEEYDNKNSQRYRRFAEQIEDNLDNLFRDVPGSQATRVVKIQKRSEDSFSSLVTVDLESKDYNNATVLEDTVQNQVSVYHTIGGISVRPEKINFFKFDGSSFVCKDYEIQCGSGECVPAVARCNGIYECPDESDERGCEAGKVDDGDDDIKNEADIPDDGATTTTTTTTTTAQPQEPNEKERPTHGRCRADDVVRCPSGDVSICAEQECDGVEDCPDGQDEINCNNSTVCATGELACDISRCIAESQRCDGKTDCQDETDERDCPAPQCLRGQFKCSDGLCILENLRCDGRPDCSRGEDEYDCPTRPGTTKRCENDEFTCGDGACVPIQNKCNGRSECRDGSDERSCPCNGDQFRCGTGLCIPLYQRCDKTHNCQDGSDETNCTYTHTTGECHPHQKHCDDGTCVDQIHFCNGRYDCPDRSDELHCCSNDQIRCSNGSCLPLSKKCDGVADCENAEDEDNCASGTCGIYEFRCDNGQCIESSLRCDQYQDCSDGSDEHNCRETDPSGGDCGRLYRCRDGTCVNGTSCDHVFDCYDGSDEADCSFCAPGSFRCSSGECISEKHRCDKSYQCRDGSDERDCVPNCPPDQFRCGDVCMDQRRICDGRPDCPDGSDEYRCPTTQCTGNEFKCEHDRTCIEDDKVCDGVDDCTDAADEQNCSQGCSSDEFDCGTVDECIPLNRKCDGRADCANGLDEHDCPVTPRPCDIYEFRCNDGSCISIHQHCDGRHDCRDGSDEHNCSGGCRPDEFRCNDGGCGTRCNGRTECGDGSDEHNCHTVPTEPPPVRCGPGQDPCKNGFQCGTRCNNLVECNDYSDEENCPFETEKCASHMFRCENGPCIDETLRCDGKVDCLLDSSDELDCHEYANGGSTNGLNLRTYPTEQEIKESSFKIGREVVFQCRDEGPLRARVHWSRGGGSYLPPGSRDVHGRLEMPNIQLNHSGTYICSAIGYPTGTPGAQVSVQLHVNPYIEPTARPPQACGLSEATCSNGYCIEKHLVCDGKFDCSDGSDETRCNPHGCEPNEFRCNNRRCVLKTWLCDSDDDCGDNSDEQNCAVNPPGSQCSYNQFPCRSGNQCIPKSFHCDQSNDCADGSDEIGCSSVVISRPPPPMIQLQIGETFEITCTAVGIPIPEVIWRLNWGHIPEKCRTTSINGLGTLICENIQESDQGAYSCEGINIKGSVIATPDTILVVGPRPGVCPKGFFNEEARNPNECISCFCFGVTKECNSADLFTYHLQPPFDSHKFFGVKIDPHTGVVDIRDEPIYKGGEPRLTPISGRNGVQAFLENADLIQTDVVPYFAMPENYHGNQLKSYGGYLKYNLRYRGYGTTNSHAPDVILTGNGYTLLHAGHAHQPERDENIAVRFFTGEWVIRSESTPERMATREEIMMTLAAVENILIKLQYAENHLDTTIESIEMDSAAVRNTGLGQATYVEECRCPVGYDGLSCESCAPGYSRHRSGPWLGQCYKEIEVCRAGMYGDPSRGIACKVCPCPLTNSDNQFGRTCALDYDGDVRCDCPSAYVGRRCETCAQGYTGNPLIPGDYCKPASYCNTDGTSSTDSYGQCRCKPNTDGATCDTCKKNTFHLSGSNQFGCISCFCMGITDECTSSNWYRDQISAAFTRSKNEFKLAESTNKNTLIDDGITLDQNTREIVYSNFRLPDVYYWSLPSRFLGDKVSSYGGNLKYSLRYVPTPGGQSSKNNAPDVELISENHIILTYFARDQPTPNRVENFSVPLLEQYWQRQDGQKADREHLMMALADVKAILIKATYTTNTREAALQAVSLDISTERNTGFERASAVEQCYCPMGYRGLSCEDCDAGYTRAIDGIYLGRCEKCQCNGHSNECDPESGQCFHCKDFTAGPYCDACIDGYEGDPSNREPCKPRGEVPSYCQCDLRGSISNDCIDGVCRCKTNVQGSNCDRCREGTFGLNASIPEGCQSCFCSGVATECQESTFYIEQIPSAIISEDTHGYSLINANLENRITTNFDINPRMNEIGYSFKPSTSNTEKLYWSLPSDFIGNKIKSYGGKLEFTQRYTQRPQSKYTYDKDVILVGNGITIYWMNSKPQQDGIANKISVTLSSSNKWQRIHFREGPRPASREDILKVLADVSAILIRAQLGEDTASSFISDLTLDTAVEQYTSGPKATNVEVCMCPARYSGTSCEQCSPGYYRDIHDIGTGPLGSCSRCPCNSNENSCHLGPNGRVECNCLPGYAGYACEHKTGNHLPPTTGPTIPPEPPTITVQITSPQLTIHEIGSEVRFICNARSIKSNNITIHWTKKDSDLPERAIDDNRGLLVITDLRVSDSGNYVCEASDGYTIVSESVNLAVGSNEPERPIVTLYPTYLEVNSGEPIELQCSATGNPTPSLNWLKVTHDRLSPVYTYTTGTFRIQNAQKSDEGEYECTASNLVGQHTARTMVRVKETPGPLLHPIITPASYSGTTGSSFTLKCETGVSNSDVYWTKDGGHLPYNSNQEHGLLIVSGAEPIDSGVYVCTASLSGTVGRANASVNIFHANTGVYPTVKIEPNRQTVSQGSDVEIHCEATGSPAPTIKWTKLGESLGNNVHQTGPVLKLYNVRVTDRGVYVCVASNQLGLAQASSVIEVERRDAPVVSILPEQTQTVHLHGSAIVQCRIMSGTPEPTLRWHRPNGEPLHRRIEQLTNGVLRFSHITEDLGGEYVCTAENDVGKVTAIANIIVNTPPVVTITPDTEILNVQPGEFVHLECHAAGSPTPTVQWSKYTPDHYDEFRSAQAISGEMSNTAIYEITNVGYGDEGVYTCMGKNEAGAHEARIMLAVGGDIPKRGDITGEDPGSDVSYPPKKDNERRRPHEIDEQTFTVPVGNRADLRCNIKNNDGNQIYTQWIRANNSSMPHYSEVREGTLIITNAQTSDAGEYNCLGISKTTNEILFKVTTHLKVLSAPRITLNPTRQVVRPGDSAVIQCSATGEQPIDISWNGLNRTMPSSAYARAGYLQFRGIQVSDAGRYKCTAINSVGEADSVAEVLVEEVPQPTIQAANHEQGAFIGSTVTLTCNVHSQYGNPTVFWYRENQALPSNAREYGNELKIFNIQPTDEGKYLCKIAPNSTDYINLHVTGARNNPQAGNANPGKTANPTLDIQSSNQSPHVGDDLELHCRSSEPGVITMWRKLSGRIANNVITTGANLKIRSVRLENGGVYRCEARGYDGIYHKDYHVDVIDDANERDIPVKSAPKGSTIILECKTDLDEPVTYLWSKQKGVLPRNVDINAKAIELNEVESSDAGKYICTSMNSFKSIDTAQVLLITGIVPYFTQAPSSYITLPPVEDSYTQFSIEISFKPEVHDGLILYNGNNGNSTIGDFISLSLVNGIPEFRFNIGHNTTATVIDGQRPLTVGQWHTVKISRTKRRGSMYVDGEGPYVGTAPSKFSVLTLMEPLYLGGVPNFDEISPLANARKGIVGCISRLKIGNTERDIMKDSQAKRGITSCETCSDNPCVNNGVCQEALGKEGFMCICPQGFSGPSCNKLGGESCTITTCGVGRCIDTEESYTCLCPLGKTGRNCDREISIMEPAFSRNAYIAYQKPAQLRRLKVSMKIKAKDLSDGVIAYCGEHEEGDGDFVSLAIKDKHLEFRFDVGNGPIIIRSKNEIPAKQWVVVTASRILNEGRLMLNGDMPVVGRSTGNHRALNLDTLFYIGGYDKERVKLNSGVGVTSGFNGCITAVTISSSSVDITKSEDSANVQDCSNFDTDDNTLDNEIFDTEYSHGDTRFNTKQTGCSSSPCRNDGQCSPISPISYRCACINGYSGVDCEVAPNLCDQLQPCQNRGMCRGNTSQYACDCPLGFTGINCESTTTIRNDVHFSGNGYMEFKRDLLPHTNDNVDEVIALELSTNSSDGLIFWHGQRPEENGDGQDFISLAVVKGYLEYAFELGSGPVVIYNNQVRVDDGMRHRVILKRRGKHGSIEVDSDFTEEAESDGITNQLNCNGNIYLGGAPNISLMTGHRYAHGFNGCIHGFELQDSKTLDLGATAASGLNVKACYRSDRSNSVFDEVDDDDEEEYAN